MLFEDVKLRFTRSTELQNLSVREFHIELEVPMNRDYRDRDQGMEAAHAY